MSNEMRMDAKARVLQWIPKGKDTKRVPETAGMIAQMVRLPERTVRKLIEELRNEGHLICNDQDGQGYYIAETEQEIRRQYRQDCARAMSILRRIKPFRHAIRAMDEYNGDQVSFEDMVIEELLIKGEL